jgi:translation initiation factor 2 beta subunit (eIF-2beta)/eIF-5
MGYEIGAQAKFDAAKPERQQAYISGEHTTKDLSQIMLQFINEVVLCPVCSLPELLLNFEQKNKVMGRCRACGGNSELPITSEKFRRYVINHPPSTGKGEKAAFAGNKAAK